ncbi:hypothetical protein F5Y09DRAFT_356433 [Xylaria sp. FL1042]|nr:hypothetical protein F5Y09DRAFT_356433 [Xylaria sp. FL1042]
MGKSIYSDDAVYTSRPYHGILYMSDDDTDGECEDSICVWPDLSPLSDFSACENFLEEEEPLRAQLSKGKQKQINDYLKGAKNAYPVENNTGKVEGLEETKRPKGTPADIPHPQSGIDPKTGLMTKDAFREREIEYALSTTRRNLTHISQFLLKLEARAGKVNSEGIRQTLDATVSDMNYDFSVPDPGHYNVIEEIKNLSSELYYRLYIVDRHWRRVARDAQKAGEEPSSIGIRSEPDVREWINTELKANHLRAEETCFYTVSDLAANRSFYDWITYLRGLCDFRDHPNKEGKLVELAWRFLDRNLRGPRPVIPTTAEQFIEDLYRKWKSGVWAEVLKNPKKQELDDVEAWKTLRRYWTSRTAPI